MDIQFYGANCLVLSDKHTRIVIDDTLDEMGGKSVTRPGDICLFTAAHPKNIEGAKITIDIAGEYEVNGVSIHGLQARAHMDEEKDRNATMYKIMAGDVKILVTGHVFPKFSDTKLEDIGLVDIMCVPVGGNGYTVDPIGALQLVKQVEPKVVVLTHYDDTSLKFPVPQQAFDDAVKAFGMEP
ncbi:MBL fold metallo-hydrolase, partial [Candidatus Saccharibacteria bacterium]|nr:MBL fold metallo-hydrolase [Candidatus Saccharibacteria bacterium]